MTDTDPVATYLAEVREREQAATAKPWWSDQDEDCYRLHGVAFRTPPWSICGIHKEPVQDCSACESVIPEQVVNKQIAKAPKQGTPYAEYWPDAADDAFITHARIDIPRLLAALDAVLARHAPVSRGRVMNCCRGCEEENGEWHEDCCHEWPCPTYRAISAALLGETP